MTSLQSDDAIPRIVGDIVVALLQKAAVYPEQLPDLVRNLRLAFEEGEGGSPAPVRKRIHHESSGKAEPAELPGGDSFPDTGMPLPKTVFDDYIVCLEDGRRFRSLRRHLRETYQLSPEEYRTKWGLPDDYPMVAPALRALRSELAFSNGFGKKAGETDEVTGSAKGLGSKTRRGTRANNGKR